MDILLAVLVPWILTGLVIGPVIGKHLKQQRKHHEEMERLWFRRVPQ